ncbi:MAG: hypothetical protein PVH29_05730 [Candidatus Zixiibacteriota bacterium]|jgi:hypothetical protein
MTRPFKAVTIAAILTVSFGATFPSAALGVSPKTFAAGVGDAYAFMAVDFLLAGAIAGLSWAAEVEVGLYATGVVFGAYPFAAALGCDAGSRAAGDGAPNRLEATGYATLAAYGETALLGGIGLLYDKTHRNVRDTSKGDLYLGLFIADVATKPFLVTYVYHRATKAPAPGEANRGLILEPYVDVAVASDGRPLPLYGLSFSF